MGAGFAKIGYRILKRKALYYIIEINDQTFSITIAEAPPPPLQIPATPTVPSF